MEEERNTKMRKKGEQKDVYNWINLEMFSFLITFERIEKLVKNFMQTQPIPLIEANRGNGKIPKIVLYQVWF